MAYRIEGTDIVIDGWEKGISDNPFEGINNMKGVNIISVPGEASANFGQYNVAPVGFTGTITSVDSTNDIITGTISTGSVQSFAAIVFTGTPPTGITAGTTYWVSLQSSNSFKLYTNCFLSGSAVNITSTTTGATFATINMGRPKYTEKNYGYILDSAGRCWTPLSSVLPGYGSVFYAYMGNDVSAGTGVSGNGLVVYKGSGSQNYLFIFKDARIDYAPVGDPLNGINTVPVWVTDWNPLTGATGAVNTLNASPALGLNHEALVGQDNVVYYTDASYVGSLREKTGSTFDPTNTTTYTWTKQALAIPLTDTAQCLEELGTNLMVGGKYNYIYPWDRISSSFRYPILCAERSINRMITVNNNIYVFAGYRGRIFICNGSNIVMFKKIPDHISGTSDPILYTLGPCYYKNQIYFGVSYGYIFNSPTNNNYSGVWAIDIDTEALRVALYPSTSTARMTAMVAPNDSIGLLCGWTDSVSGVNGVDASNTNATNGSGLLQYSTIIETDLIPVGQYLTKATFQNVEYKTTVPLADIEKIKISWRSNMSMTYTEIKEWSYVNSTEVGSTSEVNWENTEWIQFKIETKPYTSFVRLKEIRLR